MNESQTRSKFAAYFLDLKQEQNNDGATVDKATEWELFIDHLIYCGTLTEQARRWKCPRSLKYL